MQPIRQRRSYATPAYYLGRPLSTWQAALNRGGNKAVTIITFPKGDHSLIESETGGPKEIARARRFVPEYFPTLRDWTLKQAALK